MAAGFDLQAGLADELGATPLQRDGALGESSQHVEAGERPSEQAQGRDLQLQGIEHLLEQELFTGQRAFLRRQCLVFEGLQFGRDVALGVLQRLAALVVGGDFVDLALSDLDIKTVHAVELHAQIGNAGAGALTRFQIDQEAVAVVLDRAQLVELSVKTGRDHAAVAQHDGRLVLDGQTQHFFDLARWREAGAEQGEQGACRGKADAQLGQDLQRGAQAGQLARSHLAQGNARGDALDVRHLAQTLAQRLEPLLDQGIDGLVSCHGLGAIAPRVQQPVAQRAAAHAGAAGVEQGQQRGRRFAAQGLREFQIALGAGRQVEQVAAALHLQALHMRERAALRVLGIAQQCGGRRKRSVQVLRVVAGQTGHAELFAQLARAQVAIELPGGSVGGG